MVPQMRLLSACPQLWLNHSRRPRIFGTVGASKSKYTAKNVRSTTLEVLAKSGPQQQWGSVHQPHVVVIQKPYQPVSVAASTPFCSQLWPNKSCASMGRCSLKEQLLLHEQPVWRVYGAKRHWGLRFPVWTAPSIWRTDAVKGRWLAFTLNALAKHGVTLYFGSPLLHQRCCFPVIFFSRLKCRSGLTTQRSDWTDLSTTPHLSLSSFVRSRQLGHKSCDSSHSQWLVLVISCLQLTVAMFVSLFILDFPTNKLIRIKTRL